MFRSTVPSGVLPPPDIPAGGCRHRRFRAGRVRVHRFPCVRRPANMAGLPLGPTGFGDSPYQCFSAFAGNTLLVSLGPPDRDGLLRADNLATSATSFTRRGSISVVMRKSTCDLTASAGIASSAGRGSCPPARFDSLRRDQRAGSMTTRSSWRSRTHTHRRLARLGFGARATRSIGARRGASATPRGRSAAHVPQFLFSGSGAGCANMPGGGDPDHGRSCRSSSRTTAPMCGRKPELFQLDATGRPRCRRRPARLLQRHRPALGESALRLGRHARTGTRGGSIASAPR